MGPGVGGWGHRNGTTHHFIPNVLHCFLPFPFCSSDTMLSCSRGLISKEKGASTRRHTKETIELETEVSAQRLRAFHVSEPTKKGVIALAGATNARY